MAARRSRSSSVNPLMQPARIASSVVPGTSRMAPARAIISSGLAARDGTGSPSPSLCVGAVEVEKPIAPARHAAVTSWAIAAIWSGVAGPWQSSPRTDRRTAEWPMRKPAFTPITPVVPVEPVVEGLPVPAQARLERCEGHALHAGHHPHEVGRVLGSRGGEGEPAVAAEHCGDAMESRRRGCRVPAELRVVVGVQVDEPRRHDETSGIDLGGARLELVGGHDATVADGDVANRTVSAGAIDHEAALDQEGGHRNSASALAWVSWSITSAGRWPIRWCTSSWVWGQVESACG